MKASREYSLNCRAEFVRPKALVRPAGAFSATLAGTHKDTAANARQLLLRVAGIFNCMPEVPPETDAVEDP